MGELKKDDQEPKKRKIAPVPYYTFQNDFATYAASTTFSAPTSSSGSGLIPKSKNAYAPDEVDGHDHKKFKTVDGSYHAHHYLSASATLKAAGSFSSLSAPSSPKRGPQRDILGSPGFSTPSSISGPSCPSTTSSISPSSLFSSQDSMNSTAFGRSASLPSKANTRDDVSHGDQLDLLMARRLFERSTTKGIFNNLKTDLQPVIVSRLKELSELKPTFDVGLEMADSAYLLKLLNSSNPELETVGKKAGKGAMLLQEGMRLIAEAQEVLQSAILESSTYEN